MRVGRAYIAALCLALVALIVVIGVSQGGRSGPPTQAQIQAMQSSALARLHLPAAYVRTKTRCAASRCYVVASPSSRVAALMPGLLRSAGFQSPGRLKVAEPTALLRLTHWSIGSSDPYVVACKTVDTTAKAKLGVCQDAGRVGSTLVNVLVEPYQSCREPRCTEPGRTEVLTWSVANPTGT